MTTKNRIKKLLPLTIMAMALSCLVAASVSAGTISYLPISGDADSGISTDNTYTHAIDFGNQPADGGVATVNGVIFANGSVGSFPAIGESSQTVGTGSSTMPNNHDGDAAADAYLTAGGMRELVHDMIYNDGTAVIQLTGLIPGQLYQFRLYHRVWGGTRPQDIGFDTDGIGTDITGAEDTAVFFEDDATQPDPNFATATQVYAFTYDYTLSPGVTTLTIYINQTGEGTYHFYGLTNQGFVVSVPGAPTVINMYPADNATDVKNFANLVVTFNEGIAVGSGDITIKNLTDAAQTVIDVTDGTQVSVAGATLTIDPNANLDPGADYAIQIDAGAIEDVDEANAYAGIADDTTWNFSISPATYYDGGFETPDQGDTGWNYYPNFSGSPWTFSDGTGLSGPGGPWRCNSTSPDPLGDQFAFLQSSPRTISQDLSGLIIGNTYQVNFFEATRTNHVGNDLSVILDEGLSAEVTIYNSTSVTNATWELRSSSQFVPTKTSYTLTFRTTNPLGTDTATIIDGVLVYDVFAPTVNAGPDMATISGLSVPLDPTIVNNDPLLPALTYVWIADPDTDAAITENGTDPDNTSTPGAVVTITQDTPNDAVVTMALTVTRPGSNPVPDTRKIYVYENSCKARVAAGQTDFYDSTDINTDCNTNIKDFAILALDWLSDYAITAPVAQP